MADRYWVGGTGTWDATAGTKWSTQSGGSGGASVPGAADIAIFDSNSNPAGSGASFTVTRSATTAISGLRLANPSAGTLTFAGSGALPISGNDGLVVGATVNYTATGLITHSGTTTTFTTNGNAIAAAITVNGGSVTLSGDIGTAGTLTHTGGTISLGSNTLSCNTHTAAGTRTFDFGTGTFNVTSTSTATVFNSTGANFTASGNKTVNITGNAAGGITRTIAAGATSGFSESNALNFNITAGAGTVQFASGSFALSLNTSGFTGTVNASLNGSINLYGSLLAGSTNTAVSADLVFISTGPGNTITSNGKLSNSNFTFNGAGGSWTLQDSFSLNNSLGNYACELITGTLNLNNNTLTLNSNSASFAAAFRSLGILSRTLNFGSSGSIVTNNTGTGTYDAWNTNESLTILGTPSVTVNHGNPTGTLATANITVLGGPTESNTVNFTLLSPNGGTNVGNTININGTAFRSILMAGMTGGTITFDNEAITLYGSFSLPTTTGTNVSFSANANAFIFASTQSGNTITTNGRAMFRPLTFNGLGGAWTLQDALNMGTNALTLAAGSLNTGGFNVTAANVSTTGTSTRSLTLGASTITLSATGATAFWDATSTGLTLSSGTSTIIASGAAPTFNGAGLTYNNLTFNNAAVSAVNINGNNTFGTVTFTRPTSINYVPVTFSANQTMAGLTFTGTTAGNFRFLFNSSALGTQRTLTLNGTLTALNDTDFRDIAVTGSSAPWTGTRLGNATNNSGITFASAKTVWWGGSNANWSGTTWALTSGGATSADNFPLPQDTVNIASGPSAIVNYNYTIGTLNISSGGTTTGLSIATGVTAYLIGNVTVTSGAIIASGTGQVIFYSPTGVATPIVLTYNASARMRMPITINCAGGFQLGANLNTVSATLNTGFTLTHVRGAFETQNFDLTTQTYISLNTPGYTRSLSLGSSTFTLVESAGAITFQVETENYTFTAGTSTIVLSGGQFDFLSDGNLTFYNLSLTSTIATHQRVFASTSYFNNSNVVNKINFTVSNNFAITGRSGTGDENAIIRFMGISSITVSGTFSVSASASIVKRTTLFSEDDIMTLSATTLGNLSDTDFSGITASGASTPWTGTRIGNAGRNSNITFTAPKTVYFARTTSGTFLWKDSTNWSATLGGATSIDNFPLAQDTVIFTDTYPASGGTPINADNYCFSALDFSSRTVAMNLNIRSECITAANVNIPSAVALINSGGSPNYGVWNLTGSNQTFTTSAGKNILQHIRIISNGTVQLGSSITITDTDGIDVISGTLDINGFVVTTPRLGVYYPSTKTIAFGAGSISINGNNATVVNAPYNALAGLTVTGTPTVNLTYNGSTGTRVIETAGAAMNINITAGTDIVTVGTGTYPSGIINYNLQGFAGTWSHNLVNLYGNLTVGSTVATIQDVSFDYVGTGASTLTSSGKTLRGIIEVNSAGSLSLADNLTLTAFSTNLAYLQLTSGTFNAAGFNVTVDRVISTGTNSRTLTLGSGTWLVTANDSGTTYAWDMSPGTNLTIQPSTSIVRLSSSGEQTFYGGAKTYNTVSIAGVGPKYIRQNNTFDTFNNTVQPCTILFGAGETQTFTNFNLAGTAGNLVTIGSTSTSNATLFKLTTWNVGANSVNGGNNVGLTFSGPGTNDYLSISYITGTNSLPADGIIFANITGSGFSATF
jgi:hypothetical protein